MIRGETPFGVLLDWFEDQGEWFDPRWRSDEPGDVHRLLDEAEGPDRWVLRWYAWWWRDRGGLWWQRPGRRGPLHDLVPGLLWLAERNRWPRRTELGWTFWSTDRSEPTSHRLPLEVIRMYTRMVRNGYLEWYADRLHAAIHAVATAVVVESTRR